MTHSPESTDDYDECPVCGLVECVCEPPHDYYDVDLQPVRTRW